MIPKEYHILPFTADGWGASGIYFMPRAANGQLIFGSVAHRFESLTSTTQSWIQISSKTI